MQEGRRTYAISSREEKRGDIYTIEPLIFCHFCTMLNAIEEAERARDLLRPRNGRRHY